MEEKELPYGDQFKRFMVFGSDDHYPAGGLSDVVASYDTFIEAITSVTGLTWDSVALFDRVTGREVELENMERIDGEWRW